MDPYWDISKDCEISSSQEEALKKMIKQDRQEERRIPKREREAAVARAFHELYANSTLDRSGIHCRGLDSNLPQSMWQTLNLNYNLSESYLEELIETAKRTPRDQKSSGGGPTSAPSEPTEAAGKKRPSGSKAMEKASISKRRKLPPSILRGANPATPKEKVKSLGPGERGEEEREKDVGPSEGGKEEIAKRLIGILGEIAGVGGGAHGGEMLDVFDAAVRAGYTFPGSRWWGPDQSF